MNLNRLGRRFCTVLVAVFVFSASSIAQARSPVVVLEPEAEGLPLFPDERGALRKATVRYLESKKDLSANPVAHKKMNGFANKAKQKGSCGAAPGLEAVLAEAYRSDLRAHTGARCFAEGCWLTLQLKRPATAEKGANTTVATWATKVADPADMDSWTAAFDALRVGTAKDSTPLGIRVDSGDAKVGVRSITASGSWSPVPTAGDFEPAAGELAACHVGGLGVALTDRAVLEISKSGEVSRCHADLGTGGDTGRDKCICDALGKLSFPEGKANRRAAVALEHASVAPVSDGGRMVRAGYSSVEGPPSMAFRRPMEGALPALAKCFAGFEKAGTEFVIEAAVGKSSAVGKVEVHSKDEAIDSKTDCIRKVIKSVAFPCPIGGSETEVRAKVKITAQ